MKLHYLLPAAALAVSLAACGTAASTASAPHTTAAKTTAAPKPTPKPVITHTIDFTVKDAVSGSCAFPKAAAVRLADEHGTILAATSLGAPTEFLKGVCYYSGTFGLVSPKPLQYVLTSDAFQGTVAVSHDALAANGWVLPVNIYNDPNG